MKFIGKILALVLLGINALVVLLMLVSAYSPYIDPYLHPMWSCSGLLFPVFLLANFLFLCFFKIFTHFNHLSLYIIEKYPYHPTNKDEYGYPRCHLNLLLKVILTF